MAITTTSTNGKAGRKQLSDQLDRLDAILDCLAEGLPGAVADAAREGVRQAVQETIAQLALNPDLAAAVGTVRLTTASRWDRLKAALADVRCRAERAAACVTAAACERCRRGWATVTSAAHLLTAAFPAQRVVLTGAAVGLAAAVVTYAAPHGLTAAVTGIGSAVAAVGVLAWARVRRLATTCGLA